MRDGGKKRKNGEKRKKEKLSREYNSAGLNGGARGGGARGGGGGEIISSLSETWTVARMDAGESLPPAELDKFSIRSLIGRLFHPPRKRIQ